MQRYHNCPHSQLLLPSLFAILVSSVLAITAYSRALSELTLYLLLACITSSLSLYVFLTNKTVLDPIVWFPPAFAIYTGWLIAATALTDTAVTAWFASVESVAAGPHFFLLTAISIGLAGIYSAVFLDILIATIKPSYTYRYLPYKFNLGRFTAQLFLIIATGLIWSAVLSTGVTEWFTANYGANQRTRDLQYYLQLLSSLIWFPSFALYLASYLPDHKIRWARVLVLALLYLAPYVLWGSRSVIVYSLTIVATVTIFHRKHTIRLKAAIISLLLVATSTVAVGWYRTTRTFSLDIFDTGESWLMLLNIPVAAGAISQTVFHWFPTEHAFMHGETVVSAVINLIPSFLWSEARPGIIPNIYFVNELIPGANDHGFGFSVLAEGYMNAGLFGVFLILFGITVIARLIYRRTSEVSIVYVAAYSVVVYQTLWFIRSDSLAYLKSLIYAMIVLVAIILVSSSLRTIITHESSNG